MVWGGEFLFALVRQMCSSICLSGMGPGNVLHVAQGRGIVSEGRMVAVSEVWRECFCEHEGWKILHGSEEQVPVYVWYGERSALGVGFGALFSSCGLGFGTS